MFAGATKPKPFQRKRPNLSKLPASKLPGLVDMRNQALDLHNGSYKPCAPGVSRRTEIALQHIYEGCNSFHLEQVRGSPIVTESFRSESSRLELSEEGMAFLPQGPRSNQRIDFPFQDIASWQCIDSDRKGGVEIFTVSGETIYFGVQFVRDVKHTLEYYWNTYKVSMGDEPKMGSTHGRPIQTKPTLSGDAAPGEMPIGSSEVVDLDGTLIRPGSKVRVGHAVLRLAVLRS
jgi:hypothetical protein